MRVMTTDSHTGIRVRDYPASIPDAALDALCALLNSRGISRAPRFAAWLIDTIVDEQARRLRWRTGDSREPRMPVIPVFLWTDAEVGEAIVVANALRDAMQDERTRQFLRRVNIAVVALAAHRLNSIRT